MDDYYYDYDDHNYDDAYHDDLLEEDFAHRHQTTFAGTWSACMLPSFLQILRYIRTFLQWNILYIVTTQIGKKKFQELFPVKLIFSEMPRVRTHENPTNANNMQCSIFLHYSTDSCQVPAYDVNFMRNVHRILHSQRRLHSVLHFYRFHFNSLPCCLHLSSVALWLHSLCHFHIGAYIWVRINH